MIACKDNDKETDDLANEQSVAEADYENNDDYIIKLINMMTLEEKKRILEIYNFDNLRNILRMTKKKNLYKQEYETAKIKFNYLIENDKLKNLISKIIYFYSILSTNPYLRHSLQSHHKSLFKISFNLISLSVLFN